MASKNIAPETLLLAIADLIDEFPDLHEQEHWETAPEDNACGTKACIAGWACILGTNDFKQKDLVIDGEKSTFWIPKKRTVREYGYMYEDEDDLDPDTRINRLASWEYFGTVGADLLGLDADEAQLLFHGEGFPRNNMTVPEALRAIANGAAVDDVWTEPSLCDSDCCN